MVDRKVVDHGTVPHTKTEVIIENMDFIRPIGRNEAPPAALLATVLLFTLVLAFGPLHGQDVNNVIVSDTSVKKGVNDAEVITPERLSHMMDSMKIYVFDCNEPEVFEEAHVPGAVLTVYDEVSDENLPMDHRATLAFYCYSPECPGAATAAKTALTLGFNHVYCMLAGITGWQDAKLRTEP